MIKNKEAFWKIVWNDGTKSFWSLREWSATAIQGLKNAVDVQVVHR